MQTTLKEGTGRSARWHGFTKTGAGKTGTTNDNTNAWFCGFTPSFCGGVWVGFDDAVSMGSGATGARMALPIWARFLGRIADERGEEPFVRPPGLIEKRVCLESGKLATSACDSIAVEIFLPETVPNQICDRHGGELLDLSGYERDFQSLDSERRAVDDF
jgi:membrane carboxypeptidase/penicillin-binding protein